MPTSLTAYRLFIASPGGLEEIRTCFRTVIERYNTEDALRRGVLFIPVGWELTLGGMGRPQALINRELEDCDALFLVLHDRWGSNPGAPEGYTSGTEEEFNKALEFLPDPQKFMRDIYVFFKTVEPARLSDPGRQLQAVLDFKKKLEQEKKLLFQQFDDAGEFEGALRMFLTSWVRRHEEEAGKSSDEVEAPIGKGAATAGFPGLEGAVGSGPPLADEAPEDPIPPEGTELSRAAALANEGRFTEAESLYAVLTAANNNAAAAFEYGEFLFRLGRKIQAETMLRQAARIADAAGEREWVARSKAALGRLLASKGELEKGAEELLAAESIYSELGHFKNLASVRLHLGEIAFHYKELEKSTELYELALEALSSDFDADLGANIYAAVAQVNRELGAVDPAIHNYEKAIELKEKANSQSELADIYAGYGAVLEDIERLEEAEAAYTRSLVLFEERKDFSGIADISDHIGHVLQKRGRCEDAVAAFDRSAGVFEMTQNFDGAVDAYTSLGKIQVELGRHEDAAASFRQALALVSRIKNKEEVAEIYESLERLISPS